MPSSTKAHGSSEDASRRGLRRILRGASLVLILLVILAGLVATFLDRPLQALLLKLFVVVFLSFVPGWLYLQFVLVKGNGLYDEYVLNLYRLRIDNTSNLPMPPPASDYWDPWFEQYMSIREHNGARSVDPSQNIYLQKFVAVYGSAAVPNERKLPPRLDPAPSSHGALTTVRQRNERTAPEAVSPVILATALFCVGWLAVLQPEAYRAFDLGDVVLSGLPELPAEPLRFGFIGAYAFLLQTVVRRYFQSDLKTQFYVGAIARIVVVSLIVVAVDQMWPEEQGAQNAFAFVVGFFPLLGLQLIQQLLNRLLGGIVPAIEDKYPLADIDGLNIWWQARLTEEGVEDMEQLTNANLVDLMLHTRMPVPMMADWIDQAFLYLRVGEHRRRRRKGAAAADPREELRRRGIRTASNLLDLFERADHEGKDSPLMKDLEGLLREDGEAVGPLVPLRWTLEREVNLWHLRQWKRRDWLQDAGAPSNGSRPQATEVVMP